MEVERVSSIDDMLQRFDTL